MRDVICFALVGALGLVGIAGCGGNVVVDGPGTGGSGGEGGNGTTSGSTTSSTTVSPPSYCAAFCNQYSSLGCLGGTDVNDCTDGCVSAFQQYESCEAELQGLYDCILGEVAQQGCALNGEVCQKESISFAECTSTTGSCFEYACDFFDGGCYCDGECGGSYLEAQCKDAGSSYFCSCMVDGQEVGTCEGSPECGIFAGCCSGYFFEKK